MGIWDVLLTVALGAAVGIASAYVIDYFIDKRQLRGDVKTEFPSAFTAMVLEVKRTKGAVCVGIYDSQNNEIAERTYQSSKGIASDIQVGEIIFL